MMGDGGIPTWPGARTPSQAMRDACDRFWLHSNFTTALTPDEFYQGRLAVLIAKLRKTE